MNQKGSLHYCLFTTTLNCLTQDQT
uniref:Uncharacterized protein n=1 Tax=Rhizophora mucronata TaxID=61149 RepID=A0A2P2NWE0_RHIMU